ncbi:MAG: hypothetical protein ACI80K_001749, partial [Paracoccaceae bacterium]
HEPYGHALWPGRPADALDGFGQGTMWQYRGSTAAGPSRNGFCHRPFNVHLPPIWRLSAVVIQRASLNRAAALNDARGRSRADPWLRIDSLPDEKDFGSTNGVLSRVANERHMDVAVRQGRRPVAEGFCLLHAGGVTGVDGHAQESSRLE